MSTFIGLLALGALLACFFTARIQGRNFFTRGVGPALILGILTGATVIGFFVWDLSWVIPGALIICCILTGRVVSRAHIVSRGIGSAMMLGMFTGVMGVIWLALNVPAAAAAG
jgi:hypothetical protein